MRYVILILGIMLYVYLALATYKAYKNKTLGFCFEAVIFLFIHSCLLAMGFIALCVIYW